MKKNNFLIDIFLLLIISIPSFISLLNPYYFTIHDNQHPVRLYLLNEAVNQGYLYSRWVDKLTFGFGDPLFNFYPPLVYYLALIFYRLGFSLIWSIKLVFIFGFVLSTVSMFFLARKFFSKPVAFLASGLYNYLFYHAVNAYVRGALADFFTMAIIPFLFLAIINLYQKPNLKNSLFFGLALSFLILTHQLIAFSTFFFLFYFFLFYWFLSKERFLFIKYFLIGFVFGLSLSSFYWLPMFFEKQFTFLDKGLGDYRDHFIYPYQFWYSPWGFGASIKGIEDGMSFQIGKVPIFLIGLSFIFFVIYLFKVRKKDFFLILNFLIFVFLMIFGLWMTTSYSDILWRNFKMLWSLQFPWRFLAPTSVFVALTAASGIYFLEKLIKFKKIIWVICLFFIILTIFKYHQYFKPQNYLYVSDNDLVTDEEITWKQSKTVLHFVPKGVKAKKNEYGVYVLDIEKNNLPKNIFEIKKGKAKVKVLENRFQDKKFFIDAQTPATFQLNTFNFIGWQAYLNGKKIQIDDKNDYKLINVFLPKGKHNLEFKFEDTLVRKIGNYLSLLSFFGFLIFYFFNSKK
jgi:hypothetical protein